ncbi:MAG: 3-dehydroquinate synthase [Roseburia sp.]|nr:3-dehydroquinate synthase [Roseburia sp.]MCM1431885.1 3-dehydroquinate synthase [Muribaculaceae bacterium]
MSIFNVDLKKVVDDSYEIEIGYGLMDRLIGDFETGLVGTVKKLAVITDNNVRDLYARPLCERLVQAGFKVDLFVFPAGEKSKTRQTKARIEDAMLEKGYRRDCAVVAVGGGVVTDLAGFLAGTFGRGVPFVNYATTLLAAADASVGGKTAVDTPLATNLIGIFNQPKKVYIDIDTWKTLPQREIVSGMGETIKHACLASYDMFAFIEENLEDILNFQRFACEYIAENNCKIKYSVVTKDERESGLREILNLGHTVGRAIETVSDYRLLHGEAVSIGMAAQVLLSARLGYMSEEEAARVTALYKRTGLPTEIPGYIDREVLVKKLYTDKKVRDGRLRFVLQKGIGDVMEFAPGVYAKPIEEELAREIIMEL